MIEIKEIEVQKLNLKPGDILAITVKSSHISEDDTRSLMSHLQTMFPDTKCVVHLLQENDSINYSVISPESGCGPQTCADCNCGKKGE